MIVWNGFGIVVIGIFAIVFFGTQFIINAIFNDPVYFSANSWPKLVALWLTATILWPLGRWMNGKKSSQTVTDPATGQPIRVQAASGGGGHSLFFIPVEYWAIISAVGGVIALFVK